VEVVHRRCAGIDISKKDAKVCVRVQGSGRRATTASVTTWGAMSNEIMALREHLVAAYPKKFRKEPAVFATTATAGASVVE